MAQIGGEGEPDNGRRGKHHYGDLVEQSILSDFEIGKGYDCQIHEEYDGKDGPCPIEGVVAGMDECGGGIALNRIQN